MNDTPQAVRILPMDSREEFPDWSIERLQHDFFLEDLPSRPDGEYLYHKSGLAAEPATAVLFQFRGFIIASAVLSDARRFEKPRSEVYHGVRFEYEGALYFDPSSIRVFDPVGPDAVRTIWPKVRRFGRVKWSLDPKGYAAFQSGLKHVEAAKA